MDLLNSTEQKILQKERKNHIANICTQIKYIVEGNLKNCNIPKTFKQDIIPRLIQIFIENYNQNSQKQTTVIQIQNQEGQTSIFRDKINNFLLIDNKQNIGKTPSKNKQNPINYTKKLNNKLQNRISKLGLCFKVFLIAYNQNYKNLRDSFLNCKLKAQLKFNILSNLFDIKGKIINKNVFQNIRQISTQLQNRSRKIEQRKIFIQKFSLVMTKCIKVILKNIFEQFKQECCSQNKWNSIWVKKAALNSPICLQVSLWRFRNYFDNQKYKLKVVEQGCAKIINLFSNRKDYFLQILKQTKQNKKQEQGESSNSDESLSSRQFQQMFQNQEKQYKQKLLQAQEIHKNENETKQEFKQSCSGQEESEYNQVDQLQPISQEDTQKSIKSALNEGDEVL